MYFTPGKEDIKWQISIRSQYISNHEILHIFGAFRLFDRIGLQLGLRGQPGEQQRPRGVSQQSLGEAPR